MSTEGKGFVSFAAGVGTFVGLNSLVAKFVYSYGSEDFASGFILGEIAGFAIPTLALLVSAIVHRAVR